MELKSLRSFVAVAENLNFTRAAESLFISQPTLSLRIAELEKELGVALFQRTHQYVLLTAEGASLLPVVRSILEDVGRLPELAGHTKAQPEQLRLRIGFDPAEDRYNIGLFNDVLGKISEDLPKCSLDILPTPFELFESQLLSSYIDAAFVVLCDSDIVDSSIVTQPILEETTVLTAANAADMSKEEVLASREIILLDNGANSRWNVLYKNYLTSNYPGSKFHIYSDATSFFLRLRFNQTASFLPRGFAESLGLQDASYYPMEFPGATVSLTMAWNKHNLNPAFQYLLMQFREHLKKQRLHNSY